MRINRVWIFVILLLAAVVALYGQFLWNPIIFDDLPFFMVDNAGNQPVSTYHFSLFQLRSLPYATLAWTKEWFGLDLISFRVGNLLLHAAVVLALFFFLKELFDAVYRSRDAKGLSTQLAAFFAALLFALHPVATYATGYLVQRTIILATCFSLLSMLSYVYGSSRKKPLWLWMSVPFYYLAVFSKEHAIMLPAVLLALTLLMHDDWRVKLKQRWGIFLTLAAIGVFVILLRGLLGSVYEINAPEMMQETGVTYPLSIITQSWLFFKYMLLWVFPDPKWMSIDMRVAFAHSLLSPYLLALGAYLAWGGVALWFLLKRGRMGLLGFAMLFPWFMYFTEFSAVRIQEPFVLYRSYLWSVGAFALLPVIFVRLDRRLAVFILTAIALAMMPVSMERLETFSHPVLLWSDAEKLVKGRTDLPGAYRIYYNLGTELIKIDYPDQAIADLKQAIALSKDFAEGEGNLGAAYMKKRDWKNAIASFSKAIEITRHQDKSLSARYIYGRAMAYQETGQVQLAQADYKLSCQLTGKTGCDKTGLH